ncbi:MAG: MerR family transcriptional regulator [Desulfobacteraceae bacterium]|jgi:DNA-binding transcriptional MerR regulator
MSAPTRKPTLPDKLFFRIGEVSRIADVPASVLRFWESEFPRIKPHRTDTGQRVYRHKDVELILKIKQLLYEEKFTIKGARRHLRSKPRKPSASLHPDVIQLIRGELRQIRDLLK